MRHGKALCILSLAIILSLLMVVISATPALAAPVITLSPTSGAIGTEVTVTGTNFDSYKSDEISIFFNNVEIANSPRTVSDTGSFSTTFNIPDDTETGVAWVRIRSPIGSTLVTSSFVIPETEIELDIKEGGAGTVVTASGKGFYANKIITFYYYNRSNEKLGTEVATLNGEYSYHFTIPDSTAGKHRITAENAEDDSAKATFEVIPSVTLNPISGATGDILTVSGTGFGYRSEVAIYFKNTEVAYVRTNKYGSFTDTFNVPVMKADTYDVKVEDEDDNTDKAEFTIVARASLNKATGNVGTKLIVSGTGFIVSRTVTIKYDASEVATITTNTTGAFSLVFDVPISISGKHLVTVSDGTTTKQLAFTMESEAPPAPTPLLPKMGVKVEPPVYFDWEDVDDPSLPITYRFQVASDKNFTSILLEKKGLTDPEYTLTEEEKLAAVKKEAPYYWRVKAIDSAANESEWSTPGSFYVGASFALPSWAIFTLIGLGVLIISFFAFWLGRRTAYYHPKFKP